MNKTPQVTALSDLPDLQKAFKHLDKDNDGLVTHTDVITALRSEGVKHSPCVKKEIAEKYAKGMNFQQFYDLVSG